MKRLLTILFFLLCSTAVWSQTDNHPRILAPAGNAPVRKEAVTRKDIPPGHTDSSLLSIRKDSLSVSEMVKDKEVLLQLDQYIANAIARKAMPGCQVVAVKDGVLILNKSYGTYNFDEKFPVNNLSLYDIASVTKVAATTLAVMKLYEEGKILLQGNLMAYLPMVKGTDKATIRISDLLTHQAGLKSWIPFYKYTLDEQTRQPMKSFYSKDSNAVYHIPVAHKVFAHEKLIDTIWDRILTSPLENKGRYVYSDLDLLFLEQVIEQVTGMPLDMYVRQSFYKPMDLKNIMYNPWEQGLQSRCVPTERDNYFRMQLVRGYVHDQGAAMLGGVAGHAGLFSNAMDLAAIMQMLMDGGVYNGKRYFKSETVALFTGYRSSISRRGYGFDKPEKEAGKGGPAADICSKSTFGHQGFTGTCAWADPGTGIVFVMLANRVYPSAENNLFARMNVRTDAQHYVYKALGY